MASIFDFAAHADAVLAALKADWSKTYPPDKVPAATGRDYPYNVVYVDLGRGAGYRMSGRAGARAWRVTVLSVGRTDWEARQAAQAAHDRLDGRRIPVAGYKTGLCVSESSRSVGEDPDEARDQNGKLLYSASVAWTFTSTPAPAV